MANFQGDGKAIFKVFIGAIITIAIISIVATSIVGQTTIGTHSENVTAPAINGTLDLRGRSLVSQTLVAEALNVTNTSAGIFLQTATGSDGLRTVQLTLNDTAGIFAATLVNVTYTFQPDGYLSNSGARAIALLILIFGALAIMVFVVVIFIKDGSMGRLIGRG